MFRFLGTASHQGAKGRSRCMRRHRHPHRVGFIKKKERLETKMLQICIWGLVGFIRFSYVVGFATIYYI